VGFKACGRDGTEVSRRVGVQVTQRCESVVTTDERDGVGVGLVLGAALRRGRGSPGEQRGDEREGKVTPPVTCLPS
jgi:hypothetical protein